MYVGPIVTDWSYTPRSTIPNRRTWRTESQCFAHNMVRREGRGLRYVKKNSHPGWEAIAVVFSYFKWKRLSGHIPPAYLSCKVLLPWWMDWLIRRHTDRITAPILLPQPLTWEVIMIYAFLNVSWWNLNNIVYSIIIHVIHYPMNGNVHPWQVGKDQEWDIPGLNYRRT